MFEGQVAVVTGAAGGIGRSVALMLAARGAKAVIGFMRNADGLNDVAGILGHDGLVVDVTNRKAMELAIASVEAEYGRIDILVTAAGILQPPPVSIEMISERQFDKIVDVNLKGTWNAVSLIGAGMAKRGAGSIVTIASITGLEPGPLVPYGPTKAAIIEMTKSFAGAWGKNGVRVNCVSPGFTQTPPLARGIAFGLIDLQRLIDSTALGHLPTPNEVAEAVCFLASGNASGITGSMLPVDCGALVMSGFGALKRQS
jgi:NAD(P)-dependent dehydrogenase (short-subunit alcohol dehydrogenase family)